ncbi:HNH endonuclease [bacterium]|nr:HNH endonuclease [bacterium]
MRPVCRGDAPRVYSRYQDAGDDLKSRLGDYCSYCERRLSVSLAVEHISPKKLDPDSETTWENFLLGCANCNSVKGKKATNVHDWLWPDRDNTFLAILYKEGGFVEPAKSLSSALKAQAQNLLDLVGLQKHGASPKRKPRRGDKRWMDREQAFATALRSKSGYEKIPPGARPEYLSLLLDAAVGIGFFSCWLTVFKDYPEVCTNLIARMPGTATDCFDAKGRPLSRPGGRC